MKRKLLSILALLCLTVSGAWAATGTPEDPWTSGSCTVTLSNGVLTISGTGAMANYDYYYDLPWYDYVSNITSVVIEEGVTSIGNHAFSYFYNLESVTIPASVTSIGDFAFFPSTAQTVTFAPESSLTTIGTQAFSFCNNLTSISIPAPVTTIGSGAFSNCEKLASVTIPASVTSIGDNAFSSSGSNATALTVTFAPESSLTTIGNNVFKSANLTSITIPASVTSIGYEAFSGCTNLTSIDIPASVTTISSDAFSGCTNLTSITLNSNPFFDSNALPANGTVTVTMNLTANDVDGTYWTTFCNNKYNFQADANTQVFKVELNQSNGELTIHKVEDRIVNVGTPVVLKSTGNPVMTLTSSSSNDGQTNNLTGVTYLTGMPANGSYYVLNKGTNGVGFYKLKSGTKIDYGKAYLLYYGALAREFFLFEEATGIESATLNDNVEMTNDNVYDLQGRRVSEFGIRNSELKRGLYIVNGKKVVIK